MHSMKKPAGSRTKLCLARAYVDWNKINLSGFKKKAEK